MAAPFCRFGLKAMEEWPTVELTSSGVVPFPIDLCWAITRDFGSIGRVWDGMKMAGESRRVRSTMLVRLSGLRACAC